MDRLVRLTTALVHRIERYIMLSWLAINSIYAYIKPINSIHKLIIHYIEIKFAFDLFEFNISICFRFVN